MLQPYMHCHACGEAYDFDTWPRLCGTCGTTTWRNPTPVVVVIAPVEDGFLTVRRDIEPGRGKLAFPGGYIDSGETYQEAACRELLEETGLVVSPDEVEVVDIRSAHNANTLLIFVGVPDQDFPKFKPNREVSELCVVEEPVELAFPTHTEILKDIFEAL